MLSYFRSLFNNNQFAGLDDQPIETDPPLFHAIAKSNIDLVKQLIAEDSNINIHDHLGRNPLHLAVALCAQSIVEVLLEHVHDIDEQCTGNGKTALMIAAQKAHTGILEKLIGKNPDPDIQDALENTAMHYAALAGSMGSIHIILRKNEIIIVDKNLPVGTKPNLAIRNADKHQAHNLATDPTIKQFLKSTLINDLLKAAVYQINPDKVQSLLAMGANAAQRNTFGFPLVSIAIEKFSEHRRERQNQTNIMNVIRLLIKSMSKTELEEMDILHHACRVYSAPLVRLILEKNVNPNLITDEGLYPLHTSITCARLDNDLSIVSILLEYHADADLINEQGKTAVDLARGHADLERLLENPMHHHTAPMQI